MLESTAFQMEQRYEYNNIHLYTLQERPSSQATKKADDMQNRRVFQYFTSKAGFYIAKTHKGQTRSLAHKPKEPKTKTNK